MYELLVRQAVSRIMASMAVVCAAPPTTGMDDCRGWNKVNVLKVIRTVFMFSYLVDHVFQGATVHVLQHDRHLHGEVKGHGEAESQQDRHLSAPSLGVTLAQFSHQTHLPHQSHQSNKLNQSHRSHQTRQRHQSHRSHQPRQRHHPHHSHQPHDEHRLLSVTDKPMRY